jgi:hypothetical protein
MKLLGQQSKFTVTSGQGCWSRHIESACVGNYRYEPLSFAENTGFRWNTKVSGWTVVIE